MVKCKTLGARERYTLCEVEGLVGSHGVRSTPVDISPFKSSNLFPRTHSEKAIEMIDKVGAVIIKDRKMLVAREQGESVFFIPGGTRKEKESDEECLRREIREELGTDIDIAGFCGEFVTEATLAKGLVKMRAYFCRLRMEPRPCNEIEELAWVGTSFDRSRLGNILKIMIPQLERDGYI